MAQNFIVFILGNAFCQSVPSSKTVPRTVLKFTPCKGLEHRGVSLTAVSDQRLCLMESASLVRLERTFNELRFTESLLVIIAQHDNDLKNLLNYIYINVLSLCFSSPTGKPTTL